MIEPPRVRSALFLAALPILDRIKESPTGQLRIDKVLIEGAAPGIEEAVTDVLVEAGATVDWDRDGWLIRWNRSSLARISLGNGDGAACVFDPIGLRHARQGITRHAHRLLDIHVGGPRYDCGVTARPPRRSKPHSSSPLEWGFIRSREATMVDRRSYDLNYSRGRRGRPYQRERARCFATETHCRKCGRPVDMSLPYRDPTTGRVNRWSKSYGHADELDAGGHPYRGHLEHLACNSAAGAVYGNRKRARIAKGPTVDTSHDWT